MVLKRKQNAAIDCLCQIVLNQKLLHKFENWCKFSGRIKAKSHKNKSCKMRPACIRNVCITLQWDMSQPWIRVSWNRTEKKLVIKWTHPCMLSATKSIRCKSGLVMNMIFCSLAGGRWPALNGNIFDTSFSRNRLYFATRPTGPASDSSHTIAWNKKLNKVHMCILKVVRWNNILSGSSFSVTALTEKVPITEKQV